jgi:hypothetical protein
MRIPLAGKNAGFIFPSEVHMRTLIVVALLSAASLTPASAAMMRCSSDNMAKSSAAWAAADTPAKTAANKELAAANTDMSNAKMGSACKHYMKAQKAAMMK